MHTRPRRPIRSLPILAIPILALVLAACGPGGPSSQPTGTASTPAEPSASEAAPTPQLSVEPMTPSISEAPPESQTETEWGTIWDGVPSAFPRYPGSTVADDATADPVSDIYAIPTDDPAGVAAWLQETMETATYSTEGLSGPLEDGSFVLDSVGEVGCRVQTIVAPKGELVLVSVRYGATCPAA